MHEHTFLDVIILLQVFQIISNLPRISFLNLSDNPLSHSDPIVTDSVTPCSSIRQPVLNATKIPWEAVSQLLTLIPEYVLHYLRDCCSFYKAYRYCFSHQWI